MRVDVNTVAKNNTQHTQQPHGNNNEWENYTPINNGVGADSDDLPF
jgi:hypothetical protein